MMPLISLKGFKVGKLIPYQRTVESGLMNGLNGHIHSVIGMGRKHIRFLAESLIVVLVKSL